jgi:hypothetical protein
MDAADGKGRCFFRGPAGEMHVRRALRLAPYLQILPTNSVCEPGPQRLQNGFFGREARCYLRYRILMALAVRPLVGREHTLEKACSVTIEHAPQAFDADDVDADADDPGHCARVSINEGIVDLPLPGPCIDGFSADTSEYARKSAYMVTSRGLRSRTVQPPGDGGKGAL